jgi:hypothetical protein
MSNYESYLSHRIVIIDINLSYLFVGSSLVGRCKCFTYSLSWWSRGGIQVTRYDNLVFMVFNAVFNNISVLLVEETWVPGENHRPVASHWQPYHIMLYQVHLAWAGFKLTMLVVIGTDCIGSCKSNYHTIMTMTALQGMTNVQDIYINWVPRMCIPLVNSIGGTQLFINWKANS